MEAATRVGLKVQSDFFEYKRIVSDELPDKAWTIPADVVFHRLDQFLERAKDVRSLLDTILQFHRLEKIEIGGTKGKILTESIHVIYTEFLEMIKVLTLANLSPKLAV